MRIPSFTPEELEEQRDVAIDMVVFMIDQASADAKERGVPPPTATEAQASVERVTKIMPFLEEQSPEAVFVMHEIVKRLLGRKAVPAALSADVDQVLVCWDCGTAVVRHGDGVEKPCGHQGTVIVRRAVYLKEKGAPDA